MFSTTLTAQTRIDFGLAAIPTLSTMNTGGKAEHFNYILPFNYGLRTIFKKEKFAFSTGIIHLTQGAKFEALTTTASNPEGTGEYFDVFIRAKAVTVPLNVDYILKPNDKTEIFGGLGLYAGYIYSQQQENTSTPKDYQPDSTIISDYPLERFTNLDIFSDYYFAINIGLGLRQLLNDKLSLQIRPKFLFQLRQKLPADQYAWTNRLMSFSLDIGLFFSFRTVAKKEIE